MFSLTSWDFAKSEMIMGWRVDWCLWLESDFRLKSEILTRFLKSQVRTGIKRETGLSISHGRTWEEEEVVVVVVVVGGGRHFENTYELLNLRAL